MITNKISSRLIGIQSVIPLSNWNISRQGSGKAMVAAKETRTSLKITKKPNKPPFMKNVFLGIFDSEMLVYPELEKENLTELKQRVEPFKDYFKNYVDTKSISLTKMIPNEVHRSLQNLGLYGQMIPSEYGGCDQTASETAFINEILAKDLDIALTLYSHNFLGVQSLLMYGSPQLKEKYLPDLASGEKIAAFCFSESSSGSDLLATSAQIVPSDYDPNVYILNGQKKWVINANSASLFVVAAKVDFRTHTGQTTSLIRFMLVDRNSPGVVVSQPQQNLGLHASNVCEVQFKDTPVQTDCFIGGETQGFEIYSKILNNGRYVIGAITSAFLKNLTHLTTEFIISRKQFERPLLDNELVQEKFAKVANCIYALESMTYHAAAILDNYESPDCLLELAIIKVFSFTEGRRCLDLLMELMGGRAFSDSEIIQKYFRDFRSMEMFDGTVDIALLFIVMTGIHHAGAVMNETVAKMRFPYDYPLHIIKNLFLHRRQINDNPKLNLHLYEELHPSLTESANDLEYCVHRFPFAIKVLFGRHGADTVYQQVDLARLADTAVKIYAMTAVLGRASRSICIGLPNADTEVKYAIKICTDYRKVITSNLNDVVNGVVTTGDMFSFKFGSKILKQNGYFLEHPLERTF